MDLQEKNNVRTTKRRRSERKPFVTKVDFYVDADLVTAKSLDISKSGIRLTTKEPIKTHLRIANSDHYIDSHAQLVWARRNEDGSMEYGFEYVKELEKKINF